MKNQFNDLKHFEILNRSQLKSIIGGEEGVGEPGTGENCQRLLDLCYAYLNCCSGLVCDWTHKCR
jgi:hypothetical protein